MASVARLKESGVEGAGLDARVLIAHALGIEIWRIDIIPGEEIARALEETILGMIERRSRREPLAYITGRREFYSLDFTVNGNVLIPRPETELLVDLAVYYLAQNGSVLDIGTGSGAIAVAVKHTRPDARVWASDICDKALAVAEKNAAEILGTGAVTFLRGDLLAPFSGMKFDVIVSNPPYVDPSAGDLQKELDYEPRVALFCDGGGRSIAERIIDTAGGFLACGGRLVLEIGWDMKDFSITAGENRGFDVTVLGDYAGHPRAAVFTMREV
jgi:release factor glutamine methyltransferase